MQKQKRNDTSKYTIFTTDNNKRNCKVKIIVSENKCSIIRSLDPKGLIQTNSCSYIIPENIFFYYFKTNNSQYVICSQLKENMNC